MEVVIKDIWKIKKEMDMENYITTKVVIMKDNGLKIGWMDLVNYIIEMVS